MDVEGLLFGTADIECRLIGTREELLIAEAAALDIAAWGPVLGQDAEHFAARVRHGYVIGALRGDELIGTISCIRRAWAPMLAAAGVPGHPFATWDGITTAGTFVESEPDGDALFCVAVTSKGSVPRPYPAVPEGTQPALELARFIALGGDAVGLAAATIDAWIGSDPVLRFHAKPKGDGALGGAKVVVSLPGGRPADLEAMGYNVIMSYPEIPHGATFPARIASSPSPGETLVLAAAALGVRLGVRLVAPYSRPAGFRLALIKSLGAIGTGAAGEDAFTAAVRAAIA